jgi:hypothetical protein
MLAVVLNRKNASPWPDASEILRHRAVVFEESVVYHVTDFFARPALAALLGFSQLKILTECSAGEFSGRGRYCQRG